METRTYHRINKNGGTVKFLYSACDEELVQSHKWYIADGYVLSRIAGRMVRLHRLLLNLPKDKLIDHIDGNPLNNTRPNLRECSNAENLMNKGKYANNKSGYKGVIWHKRDKVWHSCIRSSGKLKHLGVYRCKHLAALAYNKAAIKYHGEFAHLNFERKAVK